MRRATLMLVTGAAILGCGPADRESIDNPPPARDSPDIGQRRDTAAGQLPASGAAPEAGGEREGSGPPSLEAALRQLLQGPDEGERAAGLHSWFSDTTADALRSVSVDEAGRAVVDFEDLRALIPNASTSAGSGMLLRELNSTAFAIPSVQSVEYRIEGSCEVFWEWLQYGGCHVQERP